MNRFESVTDETASHSTRLPNDGNLVAGCNPLMWLMALLLVALAAGCGGGDEGRDPILGTGTIVALAPTVTAVAPVNNATGVPINNTIITAAFSEPMAPITGGATFTVTCTAPCGSPTGTAVLDATNRIATFTTATPLEPLTLYTATVTGAKSLATGLALAGPYVWQFTTGVTPDTTRPSVTLTVPATTIPGPTADAPANTAITAVFTEDMAPATITAASFTVTCAPLCVSPSPAGNVGYAVGTGTAVFTPAAALEVGKTYTATITTAATDLAGNALAGNQAPLPAASNYVWTFTTAAPLPPANVSALSTNPAAGAADVCPNATINATFSVPSGLRMDTVTVNTATFTVTESAPALTPVTASSVVLDGATGVIATFTPQSPLTAGVTYTATLKGGASGVKDLAIPANTMLSDYTWNFSVVNCTPPAPPARLAINLGAAAPFAVLASASISGGTVGTTVNGNLGIATKPLSFITGFVGGGFPATPGIVNGRIYATNAPTAGNTTSATARAALNTAYLAAKARGAAPAATAVSGDLGGRTLTPGVYHSTSTLKIQSGSLKLDARGNCGAYWIIDMDDTLTTSGIGVNGNVTLLNCANAKNIWWRVGTSATLGAAVFKGNILADTAISVGSVAVTVTGRLLASAVNDGAVTFDDHAHTVSLP